MADRVTIPVVQGRQVWQLARTSRDGAGRDELPQMTAAAVRHFLLSGAGEGAGAKHELIATGPNEWRFGSVRPLKYLGAEQGSLPPPAPRGRVLADYQESVPHTIPTVRSPGGALPWQITVEFWWRAAPRSIDYPGMEEGFFGRSYELDGADWVLIRSVVPDETIADPGDQSWGGAASEAISKDLDTTLKVGIPLVAILGTAAAAYYIYHILKTVKRAE